MKYSELLNAILRRAEQMHQEDRTQFLSAPCIVAAVLELCASEYKGLTPYDDDFYPEYYEEERLRYLCKKAFRASAGLAGRYIRKSCTLAQYDFDFMTIQADSIEAEAQSRQKTVIAADIVFLSALKVLEPAHRLAVRPEFRNDFSVADALADADQNTYDYVINEIGKLVERLQAKARKAQAKRDWRPAAKFTEPDKLLTALFSSVTTNLSDNALELFFPDFFCENDGALRLSFGRSGDIYCVHDNGCALSQLRKHTGTDEAFQAVFSKISGGFSLEDNRVVGNFCQISTFLCYLQGLIFIANADLYAAELHADGLGYDRDATFFRETDRWDTQALINAIKQSIGSGYDEDQGLYITIRTTYSLNCSTVAFLIETLDGGNIRISDARKGQIEGEVFESFYWANDDIGAYSRYISRYCERFGADFDGKNISLTVKSTELIKALFRFINLAVLLSEFGRMIELPK